MSELQPVPVAPTNLPNVPVIPEPRTIADVEADLALAGLELSHHRSRRGDTVNNLERLAERPALLVQELNWLVDEWAALNRLS